MTDTHDSNTTDTNFEVDADGTGGTPAAVAAVLDSVATALRQQPDTRRYDFELQVTEHPVDDHPDTDSDEPE